jgi:hypothetical protein
MSVTKTRGLGRLNIEDNTHVGMNLRLRWGVGLELRLGLHRVLRPGIGVRYGLLETS